MPHPGPDPESAARAAWPDLARVAGLDPFAHVLAVVRIRSAHGQTRTVLSVDGPGGEMILKHAPDEAEPGFSARIAALQQARERLDGIPGCNVARIRAADRARRALLLDRVPGRTLHDAIADCADPGARLALLEAGARWAGHLHRSGSVTFGRHRPGRLLRQLDGFAAEVASGIAVADPDAYAALIDHAQTVVEAERGRRSAIGTVHGDLNLRNLIVGTDGGVTGIDLGAPGPRPAAEDLARLLVWFETLFWEGSGGPDGLKARILAAHGGRWRDGTTLDGHVAVELARLWRTVPADPARRGLLHHRRRAGVRRMAAALYGI